MKKGLFLIIFMLSAYAQALPVCATKKSELSSIKSITQKVNIFGYWEGQFDGADIEAFLYINTNDQIRGEVIYDGTKYGPANVKICDDDDVFYLSVYGHDVVFEVLSKTKIKGYSPFDANDTMILTKK